MKYTISKLGRTVNLNDALVKKYCEYDELQENPFFIVIRSRFGHNPTEEEISDKELSDLCNSILLSELKALALLPQAVSVMSSNYKSLEEYAANGQMVEFPL